MLVEKPNYVQGNSRYHPVYLVPARNGCFRMPPLLGRKSLWCCIKGISSGVFRLSFRDPQVVFWNGVLSATYRSSQLTNPVRFFVPFPTTVSSEHWHKIYAYFMACKRPEYHPDTDRCGCPSWDQYCPPVSAQIADWAERVGSV